MSMSDREKLYSDTLDQIFNIQADAPTTEIKAYLNGAVLMIRHALVSERFIDDLDNSEPC